MKSRILGAVRGIAWLAIITGFIGGCLIGYRIWDPMAGHRQSALQEQLRKAWATRPAIRPAAHTSGCAAIPEALKPSCSASSPDRDRPEPRACGGRPGQPAAIRALGPGADDD